MTKPIIEVKGLGKYYRLGSLGANSFADDVKKMWKRKRGVQENMDPQIVEQLQQQGENIVDKKKNNFWALKDISFDVYPGEVVGIIGRNGAGKSTLLKILSRITEPSKGEAILRGRVGSLLEVGTGFHPDLTGCENIYLNGTIHGLSKNEIDEKLDEIVDFAQVQRFIHTPVKRYSSGMYVRLAFAVAAHLEPQILVIDEVLAVGDVAFQNKCISKVKDVAGHGKTILFVSHNMQVIRKLCPKSLLLRNGEIVQYGETSEVVGTYLADHKEADFDEKTSVHDVKQRRGNGFARLSEIKLKNIEGIETFSFRLGEKVQFHLSWKTNEVLKGLRVGVILYSEVAKVPLVSFEHEITDKQIAAGESSMLIIEASMRDVLPGIYPLYFYIKDGNYANCDLVDDVTLPLIIGEQAEKNIPGFIKMESKLIQKVG